MIYFIIRSFLKDIVLYLQYMTFLIRKKNIDCQLNEFWNYYPAFLSYKVCLFKHLSTGQSLKLTQFLYVKYKMSLMKEPKIALREEEYVTAFLGLQQEKCIVLPRAHIWTNGLKCVLRNLMWILWGVYLKPGSSLIKIYQLNFQQWKRCATYEHLDAFLTKFVRFY